MSLKRHPTALSPTDSHVQPLAGDRYVASGGVPPMGALGLADAWTSGDNAWSDPLGPTALVRRYAFSTNCRPLGMNV